jgi:sugar phosphate isomerase/epimerase
MITINRRSFLRSAAAMGALPLAGSFARLASAEETRSDIRFGLVTYLWGKDLALPELIRGCEQAGMLGVELRTEHRHGVEPTLSKAERAEVRKRFADSPVTLVGYGSNAQFHENDSAKVKANIELAKSYIHLMHDCGGSGVKVKPNGFPKGVPRERTIEQIGRAINEVAKYGADYGQQIRVEVHGRGTSELPVMKAIFDVADHPNAAICWNSNSADLAGEGLRHNFELVKDRLGDTVHLRELDKKGYPMADLFKLFVGINYQGWLLLEAHSTLADPVPAMTRQRRLFDQLLAAAT